MGKIAFVFPGQGAQHPGMGESLYQNNSAAKAVLDRLEAQRPGTLALCFSGSAEALAETKNTQPCLFACELAAATALQHAGITPDVVAGFSLGEVVAAGFSGLLSQGDAFALVQARGALMQEDAERAPSAMAAVLKLDAPTVESLCAKFPQTYPVNYNCPGQITIACLQDSLAPFSAAVKEAGGRALPLKVRGGFHSSFMSAAAQKFGALLADYTLSAPQIPLYSNYSALPYTGDYRALLARQIENPVRWESIVRHMIADGVDTIFEVGPGNVLSGLTRKIDENVRCINIGTAEDLDAALKEYAPC